MQTLTLDDARSVAEAIGSVRSLRIARPANEFLTLFHDRKVRQQILAAVDPGGVRPPEIQFGQNYILILFADNAAIVRLKKLANTLLELGVVNSREQISAIASLLETLHDLAIGDSSMAIVPERRVHLRGFVGPLSTQVIYADDPNGRHESEFRECLVSANKHVDVPLNDEQLNQCFSHPLNEDVHELADVRAALMSFLSSLKGKTDSASIDQDPPYLGIRIDVEKGHVLFPGEVRLNLRIAYIEFAIIKNLHAAGSKGLSSEELFTKVWPDRKRYERNIMDAAISRLNNKKLVPRGIVVEQRGCRAFLMSNQSTTRAAT